MTTPPLPPEKISEGGDEDGGKRGGGEDGAAKGGERDEEEEDVELDPARLDRLLLDDGDDEEGDELERELEHQAGADKALAQVIKMKQEARKAGRRERERIELASRLRCVALLEATFSRGGGFVPESDVALGVLLPLLRTVRSLERSVAVSGAPSRGGSTEGKKDAGAPKERRALADKLSKIYRAKLRPSVWESDKEREKAREGHRALAAEMVEEAGRSHSAAHCVLTVQG